MVAGRHSHKKSGLDPDFLWLEFRPLPGGGEILPLEGALHVKSC